MKTKTEFKKVTIPTYVTGAPEEMPIFFEKRANQGASSKVYPIPYTDKLTDTKIDKEYDAVLLENEYIKVVALPQVGGKIHSALDKTNNYDFVYHNKVIKPAMIAIAGPWVSGGIEFNWPLHHRPTTYEPTDAKIVENEDGTKTVWMSEVEPYNRLKGMVGLTVPDGRSYIRAEGRVYNATPIARPFLWWANLACQIDDTYKVVFPPDVEYVNDHDRRDVLSWPIAKGVFKTARPYDYGDGVDVHEHKNIIVPSSFMISKGQCNSDFLCGYDSGKQAGTVTVANKYIATGKKLWTWANNDFGYKWCSNLTDDGSRYVELMSGVYTDNQPDFTYLAPYETKHFTQFWYPVRDIGEVKNATIDAAVNLEADGDGCKFGFYVTGKFDGCKMVVKDNGKIVYEGTADLSPEKTFIGHADCKFGVGVSAEIMDSEGNRLVEYTVQKRGVKTPIEPRSITPRPSEIKTVEELYLHAKHLVQYKHFTYVPDDYYLEGLRRDPGDARCNEGMGDLMMERGQFEEAIKYYDAAEKRLEMRNANPENTDVLYKRGLCKAYLGDIEDAYQDLYWSTWSYKNRSAGYYAVAGLASKKGDVKEAIRLLGLSLETDTLNLWAKKMLAVLTNDDAALANIAKEDALFDACRNNPDQALDLAIEYNKFGLYDLSIKALEACDGSVMTDYYLSFLYDIKGDAKKSAEYKASGDARSWVYVNPNRLADIEVLKFIDSARSNYYLGSLYYDKDRWIDAAGCWEKCVAKEEFAPAYRGLALAYYDHMGKEEEARKALEHALELAPDMPRIFYELGQLYKNINMSVKDRIAFYEKYLENTAARDDCTLEYAQLLTINGELEKAKNVVFSHKFHTYEGGEGNLTSCHAWLHKLIADELFKQGKYAEAKKAYEDGLTFPLSYGEEKSFFVNDAPLYMGIAKCEEKLGESSDAIKLACHTYGGVSPHTIWQAEALVKCGDKEKADKLIAEMFSTADGYYENRDLPPYFGVGSHAFMPFEYDTEKYFTAQALILRGYASLYKGDKAAAKSAYEGLIKINCGDLLAHMLGKLLDE